MDFDYQQQLQSIPEQKDEIEIDTYDQAQLHFGVERHSTDESEREHLIRHMSRTASVPTTSHSSSTNNSKKHRRSKQSRSKSVGHLSSRHGLTRRRSTITQIPQLQTMSTISRMFPSKMLLGKKMQSRRLIQELPIQQFEQQDTPKYYDVDQAIDAMGMGKFQWILFFILGLVSFAYGMEIMLVAFLLPILQADFGISALESTLVPLSSIIGSFVGAFVLSLLADKYGRKKIIIVGVIFTAIAAVISAFATDIYQESIARFFVGFFMKCGVVGVTLFAEFLPTKSRGKLLILSQIFWTLGLMSSIILAWITLTYLNWRWYPPLSTIPLWFAAIGVICFMPESAHYLMTAGEEEKCLKILQRISKTNNKPLPEGELLPSDASHIDQNKRGNVLDLFRNEPNEELVNTFPVETKDPDIQPTNTILLLLVYVIYQCCYYGVIFVSVRYFAKLDSIFHLHHELYWEMLLTTASELPGVIIGYFLVDEGRSLTINVSLFLYSIPTYLLVFMDFEFNRIIGISLLFLSRMFISVTGMGAGVYFLEYYPTHIRATALGLAVSISMIIKFGAIVIAEVLHIMFAMYIFGTLGIVAFVASLMLEVDWKESWFLLD